jgi:Tol biopolymer transport system component
MGPDGNDAVMLTDMENVSPPNVSPDGNWVYFSGSLSKESRVVAWRIAINGGEPEQLTDRFCLAPHISPDGSYIAGFYPVETEPGKFSPPAILTILTADGSRIVRQFRDLPLDATNPIAWTRDGTGISFVLTANGVSNIWVQNTAGGPPTKITDFQTDEIFRYRVSPDGKKLAFEKGIRFNDVLLLTDVGKQN